MQRRSFIQKIISLGGSIFTLPASVAGLFMNITSAFSNEKYNTIQVRSTSQTDLQKEISILEKWDQIYISINQLAQILDYGIYTNTSKRKTVLYVGRDKATFTADNSFVILNEQVYQFFYKPIWEQSELWIPVALMEELFSRYTSHHMHYDNENRLLFIGQKDVNITNIDITPLDNGTLIKIFSGKQFNESDITMKIANGWLHIDVYGGKVDAEMISSRKTAGVVSEIQAIQFEQLVSLAFRLKRSILSRELILTPDATDFMVNLRTKDTIDQDQQTKDDLERQRKEWMVDTIVLDPGHGGKDPGAIGYKNLYEKTIVLDVALKLGAVIKKAMPGVKVVYTRDKDEFIPLWQRTKIANEHKGKLFVSLHCNSNKNNKVKGFETYILKADEDKNKQAQEVVLLENASIEFEAEEDRKRYEGINFILATMAQNAFIRQSQYLATTIQNSCASILKPIGMNDRGVKQGRFWVLVGATMPNVLVEIGFISNKNEANLLRKTATINRIAEAIFTGIEKYKKDIESSI